MSAPKWQPGLCTPVTLGWAVINREISHSGCPDNIYYREVKVKFKTFKIKYVQMGKEQEI